MYIIIEVSGMFNEGGSINLLGTAEGHLEGHLVLVCLRLDGLFLNGIALWR